MRRTTLIRISAELKDSLKVQAAERGISIRALVEATLRETEPPRAVAASSEACPKCGRSMERRRHSEKETAYLRKPFYFTEWDYCKGCRHIQLYAKYKVVNQQPVR